MANEKKKKTTSSKKTASKKVNTTTNKKSSKNTLKKDLNKNNSNLKEKTKKSSTSKKTTSKKNNTTTKKNSNIKKNSTIKKVESNKKKSVKKVENKAVEKNTKNIEKPIEEKTVEQENNVENAVQLRLPIHIESKKEKIIKKLKKIIPKNLKKYIIITLIIIIFFCGTLFMCKKLRNKNLKVEKFEKITLKEYLDLYNTKGDLEFIYLFDEKCTNCEKYESNILKLKNEFGIIVKKLETSKLNIDDIKKIENSNELFKDGLILPTIVSIKDGKAISEISGTKEYSALKKFLEYTKKPTNNSFNLITVDKFIDLLNSKEKTIIYIGTSNDTNCEKFTKLLDSVSSKLNIKINYLNTVEITTEDNWEKLNNSNKIFKNNWFVPVIVIVKNGKIVNYKMEVMDEESLYKFLKS